MTAREYFENARAAQRRIDTLLSMMESMRAREAVRAQRYDAAGSSHGAPDAMRATDERIDAESAHEREVAQLRAIVAAAREVCRGVRSANPLHSWGDVLELRFCECMEWGAVAGALMMSERKAHAELSGALDWVDSVGIARAREGMGQAALF